MKKILITLFVCFNSFGYALRDYDQSPKNFFHLSQVINKYDKDTLVSNLRGFVKETRPTRIVGSEGHFKSVNFIIDFVKKNAKGDNQIVVVDEFLPDIDHAIKMYKDDLNSVINSGAKLDKAELNRWKDFTNSRVTHLEKLRSQKGRNVIWEKKGSKNPEEVIIIGAHYDTIAYDKKSLKVLPEVAQPGADNNGSGVSMGLSLIEVLSELKIEKTVRIIFFDFQEFGYLGSWDYAKKLKQELATTTKLYSYVNLLMLGHDSKLSDKLGKYGNMKVYYGAPEDTNHAKEKQIVENLLVLGAKATGNVNFEPVAKDFKNGDVVSFKELNIPSLTFTQDWENDFNGSRNHTARDYVETLNLSTYYDAFRFIAQSVSAWALNLTK